MEPNVARIRCMFPQQRPLTDTSKFAYAYIFSGQFRSEEFKYAVNLHVLDSLEDLSICVHCEIFLRCYKSACSG